MTGLVRDYWPMVIPLAFAAYVIPAALRDSKRRAVEDEEWRVERERAHDEISKGLEEIATELRWYRANSLVHPKRITGADQ
jgi:hypothetical protein